MDLIYYNFKLMRVHFFSNEDVFKFLSPHNIHRDAASEFIFIKEVVWNDCHQFNIFIINPGFFSISTWILILGDLLNERLAIAKHKRIVPTIFLCFFPNVVISRPMWFSMIKSFCSLWIFIKYLAFLHKFLSPEESVLPCALNLRLSWPKN